MPNRPQSTAQELRPRFRVIHGENIALGPGKAELLDAIERTGSISLAARDLGMSYMRAWTLIKTMEECFKDPLVQATRGGKSGGGAGLSETGRQALSLYREMQTASLKASAPAWKKLRQLLRAKQSVEKL